jgi:hypothetical protein
MLRVVVNCSLDRTDEPVQVRSKQSENFQNAMVLTYDTTGLRGRIHLIGVIEPIL